MMLASVLIRSLTEHVHLITLHAVGFADGQYRLGSDWKHESTMRQSKP